MPTHFAASIGFAGRDGVPLEAHRSLLLAITLITSSDLLVTQFTTPPWMTPPTNKNWRRPRTKFAANRLSSEL